ncbi:MAG: hypothetical protein BACD_01057 [Bacteroides rodentium]
MVPPFVKDYSKNGNEDYQYTHNINLIAAYRSIIGNTESSPGKIHQYM